MSGSVSDIVGHSGQRLAPPFAYIGGCASGETARFATVVAKVVAEHLGCWNEDGFKCLAQQVEETRVAVYLAHHTQRGR
ncbi:hypothetical protein [Anaeromyxobacter soli]|uniref:hypothetical protein n=1 Tax=Anaeromyxobacter soli TaxID=2922725 RepID=UPI001FB046A9|nr:hypothetical protein [Anaeromyxobacter sp. SG29]